MIKKAQMDLNKDRPYSIALARANNIFLDSKKKLRKGIKSFFPNKFREYILNEQKCAFTNAMNLYNGRNKIIKLFKDKDVNLSNYAYNAKSDGVEESEPKFYESIGQRVKLRRQKADDETDEADDDKKPDTTNMPELESEESAAQRRKQKGPGLKILTPQQTLSRLPISLAQLNAGNNSEKLKNDTRQLLHSLYRSKKLSKTIYNNLINAI